MGKAQKQQQADPANGEDRKRLRQASACLEKMKVLHAALYDLMEETRQLTGGLETTQAVCARLEKGFASEWERRYGSAYAWTYQKDRPHWRRLLKLTTEDDIAHRVVSYFHDPDKFLMERRHPFGLFVSRFNSLAGSRTRPDLELVAPVIGCAHVPVCMSDQIHTKKTTADRRAGR